MGDDMVTFYYGATRVTYCRHTQLNIGADGAAPSQRIAGFSGARRAVAVSEEARKRNGIAGKQGKSRIGDIALTLSFRWGSLCATRRILNQ
jgi:hypothetical protein